MKKIILTLLIAAPFALVAQNIKKSKEVKTSYLSYPKVDVTAADVSTIKVDFCANDVAFLEKKVKKTTGLCYDKSKGATETKAIDVFYYEINIMKPTSYIRMTNTNNEIIYMEKTSIPEKGSVDFGKKGCYWYDGILKSAYEKEGSAFESEIQQSISKTVLSNAQKNIDAALFFTYVPHDVVVLSVKSKDYDYSDMDKASELALEAYKGLKDDAENKAAQGKLREALSLWEKALEKSNPDVKDSRVNKKVTKALAENVATAYLYLREYDKAQKAISEAIVFDKNTSSPATERREALLFKIKGLEKGYEINKTATIDTKKTKLNTVHKPLSDFSKFEEEFKIHGAAEMAADMNKSKEEHEKGIADGSINPYQEYVMPVVTGNSLTLPDFNAKMMKLPAGDKLDEFPKEVLDLDLVVLVLKGNNIKSIPADITKLSDLKKLDLSNNKLTSLPVELGELKSLKKLNLKGNSIPQNQINEIQNLLPDCTIKI